MNLPNILTCIRFALIGVFVYLFLVPQNYISAMFVFAIATLTDILDGYIARKYNKITNFGKLMDPLADKLMLIAALCCFVYAKRLPPVILLFVVLKELLMILGGIVLYKKNVVVYAFKVGKVAATFFNCGVVLTFFANYISPMHLIFFAIAIFCAIIAFIQYMRSFWHNRKELSKKMGDRKKL